MNGKRLLRRRHHTCLCPAGAARMPSRTLWDMCADTIGKQGFWYENSRYCSATAQYRLFFCGKEQETGADFAQEGKAESDQGAGIENAHIHRPKERTLWI